MFGKGALRECVCVGGWLAAALGVKGPEFWVGRYARVVEGRGAFG